MMTKNEILIAAGPEIIYALAANTADWPNILPHYRFVTTLNHNGDERTVHMGARRNWIPVQWTALQVGTARIPEIRFTHIRGWTRGMNVVWRFLPEGKKTRVIIEHELTFQFPFASRWIGEHIVGRFFVHHIANRTLACIRQLAEAKA